MEVMYISGTIAVNVMYLISGVTAVYLMSVWQINKYKLINNKNVALLRWKCLSNFKTTKSIEFFKGKQPMISRVSGGSLKRPP